jgi:hypothetical protein
MSFKLKHVLIWIVALAALTVAIVEVGHVGRINEEKSLFSYLLKSGDVNPSSDAAMSHIQNAAPYGRLVALRIAIGSAVFGVLLGVSVTPRLCASSVSRAA